MTSELQAEWSHPAQKSVGRTSVKVTLTVEGPNEQATETFLTLSELIGEEVD